jgi:hypothetical protein
VAIKTHSSSYQHGPSGLRFDSRCLFCQHKLKSKTTGWEWRDKEREGSGFNSLNLLSNAFFQTLEKRQKNSWRGRKEKKRKGSSLKALTPRARKD